MKWHPRPAPYSLILLILPAWALFLPGCTVVRQQAYYVSPFNGNTGNYQTIPLQTDSIRQAFYAGASFLTGSANTRGKDHFNAFHTSISRSQNTGILQAYYGVDLTLGSYFMGRWDSVPANFFAPSYAPPLNYSLLNQYTGNHFFGGTGFNGGLNLVIPLEMREWRIIGVETSLRHEFGNYLRFRQKLPDSAATLDAKSSFFGAAGITSELIGKTRNGQFGVKCAYGWVLGSEYQNLQIYDNTTDRFLSYRYFNFTFHYTYTRYTGFVQLNTAAKATALHLGFNYRLTR
jgi:hypothetical protein